jgi:hypothetical protein
LERYPAIPAALRQSGRHAPIANSYEYGLPVC